MTAGRPRQPGMSRMDCCATTPRSCSCVGAAAAALAVRDPDRGHQPARRDDVPRVARVRLRARAGGGHGGRPRLGPPGWFLAERCDVPARDVEAMTLGSHGDTMVPLPGRATIAGRPGRGAARPRDLDAPFQRTRDGGAEIVGAAQARLGVLRARRRRRRDGAGDPAGPPRGAPRLRVPDGRVRQRDAFVGVPAVLSRRGVEEVRELQLSAAERRPARRRGGGAGEVRGAGRGARAAAEVPGTGRDIARSRGCGCQSGRDVPDIGCLAPGTFPRNGAAPEGRAPRARQPPGHRLRPSGRRPGGGVPPGARPDSCTRRRRRGSARSAARPAGRTGSPGRPGRSARRA